MSETTNLRAENSNTIQTFQGIVKYPTQAPKDYGHGARINVVVKLAHGEEIRIWDKPGSPIEKLSKGDNVCIVYDGKNYKLASTPPTVTIDESTKEQIATYIGELANLYEFCWDTTNTKFAEKIVDPTALKDISTTLFLTCIRKFNLQ